jgi:hypothetical protein
VRDGSRGDEGGSEKHKYEAEERVERVQEVSEAETKSERGVRV